MSNYGSFSTAVPIELWVLPAKYTFSSASLTFDFTVSAADQIDFDLSLDDRVFGRGTSTLIAGAPHG